MRILFLATNFKGWVAETVYHEQQAIREALPSSVFYGPGYEYELNSVPEILEAKGGADSFDAVFCYASEQSLKGGPLAPEVMARHGVPEHLSVFPRGLEKVGLPKILLINDFWHCTREEWDRILIDNGFAYVFATYAAPFVPPRVFEERFSEKVRGSIPFIPWPRSISQKIFRDYGVEKTIDVTLLGAQGDFYPLRGKMLREFGKMPGIRFFSKEHPGYDFHDPVRALVGKQYAKLLNRTRIFANCTGRFNLPFIKLYEALACRTALLCDPPSGGELLGLRPFENYIPVGPDDFTAAAKAFLDDPERLEAVQRAGCELAGTRHTAEVRAREFAETLQALLAGDRPAHWARYSPNLSKSGHTGVPAEKTPLERAGRSHILDVAPRLCRSDMDVWLKFGVNRQYDVTPPVVTTHPELKIYRSLYLRELASRSGALRFAEVGTARGLQSFTWANMLHREGLQGSVDTCDIIGMDDLKFRTPIHGARVLARQELWQDEPARGSVRFHHGDSGFMAGSLEDASLDMVYIDGVHDYEHTMNDFCNLYPKMKKSCTVIFDDCDERFPGVMAAINEIAAEVSARLEIIGFEPDPYSVVVMRFGEDR